MTGGEGASFTFNDYGQDGNPVNPCGDPPGGVGGSMTVPTAEGGALRSQDLRTTSDPVGLNGALLRIDPSTGAAMAGNPLIGSPDVNARRIVSYGLRNPYRFTIRPGTGEIWVGDVGGSGFEEINRIVSPTAPVTNRGWPCIEGVSTRPGTYQDLNLCQSLYSEGTAVAPYFAYPHGAPVAGETCPAGSGSSISGLAFYEGGTYPAAFTGALFFADYSRKCIWVMHAGSNGLPDPATVQPFIQNAGNPVQLKIGPGGDLFYVDFNGGAIHRITYTAPGEAPDAVASATPTSGVAPLTVAFNGTASTDPTGQPLTYAWDLDGDGAFDDSTATQPSFTYTAAGTYSVQLRVTDPGGLSDTAQLTITVTPPGGGTSTRYLSDLAFASSTNGWGPVERDRSNGESASGDGRTLTLNGVTYAKGLGVHAVSDVRIAIPTGCTTFNAVVGIDDESGTAGSVTFQVFGDSTSLFTSPVLTGVAAGAPVSVNVAGRAQLRLLAANGGDNINSDHADWADARFTGCSAPGEAPDAVASATPTSGVAPLTVAFNGTASTDPTGQPLTYAWDLDGDGAFDDSTATQPSFTYTAAGTYSVQLRVTDPGGLSDTAQLTITVKVPRVRQRLAGRICAGGAVECHCQRRPTGQPLAFSFDRPGFILNASSCALQQVRAVLEGAEGATATVTAPYQATDCEGLPFAPRLEATVGARGKTRIGAFAPLHAVITVPAGHAATAIAEVDLPSAVSIDLQRLSKACAPGVASCPASARIGSAVATTPLLAAPLTSPVTLAVPAARRAPRPRPPADRPRHAAAVRQGRHLPRRRLDPQHVRRHPRRAARALRPDSSRPRRRWSRRATSATARARPSPASSPATTARSPPCARR